MTHKNSRKHIGFAVTAGIIGASFIGASSPALADTTPAPIIGEFPKTATGGAINFAINLAKNTPTDKLTKAQELVKQSGGIALQSWPQISVLFAQTKDKDFSQKLAAALKANGISVVSIGPTTQAKLENYELLYPELAVPEVKAEKPKGTGIVLNPPKNVKKSDAELAEEEQILPWGIAAINADDAAKVDVKREKVTVGVLDSGIDADHPDLKDVVDRSQSVDCTVNGIPSQDPERIKPDPVKSHGTHVAGIIAAENNKVGVVGVDPQVTLASVRVMHGNSTNPEHVVCGFMWSGLHHFQVTNNSYYVDPWEHWLPNEPSQAAGYEAVKRAVEWSQAQGVLHVTSAGNGDKDNDNITGDKSSPNDVTNAAGASAPTPRTFKPEDHPMKLPAMFPGVVTTSSVAIPGPSKTDPDRDNPKKAHFYRSYFSNYGANNVTVAAPGSGIVSTVPEGKYQNNSGTSMAAPHAAGVVALLRSIHPDMNSEQIIALLKKQAGEMRDRLDPEKKGQKYEGAGLVNALAAVLEDQPKPVISKDVEYSVDGGKTWNVVKDGTIEFTDGQKVDVRVTATGPVTKLTAVIDGKSVDGKVLDESFNGKATLVTTLEKAADYSITVNAFGRNNDKRADDDTSLPVKLKLVAKPKTVVPDASVNKPADTIPLPPSASQTGDAKPGDTKPGDTKPSDVKPGDVKLNDVKPGDTSSSTKAAGTDNNGKKAADSSAAQDTASSQTNGDSKSTDTKKTSGDTVAGNTKSGNTDSAADNTALAKTGADYAPIAGLGVFALLAGAVASFVARRRKS